MKNRFQIPERIKQEIRIYKKLNPKAKTYEIAEKFEKKIGRRINRTTLWSIITTKSPIEEKTLELAKQKYIEKTSSQLAKITKRRMDYVNRAEAIVLDRLSTQLNKDEILSPELVKMLKDLTDIRGKILGTLEISAEAEVSPEQLKKLQNFEQLIDEQIKQKITQKITAIRPDPIRKPKTKNSESQNDGGKESSGRKD